MAMALPPGRRDAMPEDDRTKKQKKEVVKRTADAGLDPGFAATIQRGGATQDYTEIRREKEKKKANTQNEPLDEAALEDVMRKCPL
jgi:hypothetical protein